jgi:hypothetical protein
MTGLGAHRPVGEDVKVPRSNPRAHLDIRKQSGGLLLGTGETVHMWGPQRDTCRRVELRKGSRYPATVPLTGVTGGATASTLSGESG